MCVDVVSLLHGPRIQYLLTQLGRQTLPAPGAFDGYTLAATAFLTATSSRPRLLLSVYNSNPKALLDADPGVSLLVVHSNTNRDGTGGTLLRVIELFVSPDAPVGNVTGVAMSWTKHVIITHEGEDGGTVATAFSVSSIEALAIAGRGQPVASLNATMDGSTVLSTAVGPAQGGISFFRDGFRCALLVASGSESSAAAAAVFTMADCEWLDKGDHGTSSPAANFTTPTHVTGMVVFRHNVDRKTYAAMTRCTISRGFDCRIEFVAVNTTSWGLLEDPVYRLAVPSGAVGLAFDDSDVRQFVFGCNGAAEANVRKVRSSGQFLEGRIMVVDKPIFVSVPFGVKKNILYASFLGYEILSPRCLIPIGKPCTVLRDARRLEREEDQLEGRYLVADAPGSARELAEGQSECIAVASQLLRKEKSIVSYDGYVLVVIGKGALLCLIYPQIGVALTASR